MSMVFDRYPAGGSERLLALALADHARDDGTRIWPSIAELARKTMQSRSTVQRQVRAMVERGWLEAVSAATGRPGGTNEYQICRTWIEGGVLPERGVNLTPLSDAQMEAETPDDPVDNVIHTGVTSDDRGVKSDERGVTAMTPESSGTIRNHIPPLPPVERGDCGQQSPKTELPDARGPGRGRASKPPWRWATTRSGIEGMAETLGVGRWDEAAFQRGQGEPFPPYAARVKAAAIAAGHEVPP